MTARPRASRRASIVQRPPRHRDCSHEHPDIMSNDNRAPKLQIDVIPNFDYKTTTGGLLTTSLLGAQVMFWPHELYGSWISNGCWHRSLCIYDIILNSSDVIGIIWYSDNLSIHYFVNLSIYRDLWISLCSKNKKNMTYDVLNKSAKVNKICIRFWCLLSLSTLNIANKKTN